MTGLAATGAPFTVGTPALNFAIFADWPGAIHEGDGVAIAYVDESAGPDQRTDPS